MSTILHLTDLHLFADPTQRLRGVNTDDTLSAVLADARAKDWPPDAIVLGGDLVHDESRAGYERLRRYFGSLDVPVFCIPGNHDDPVLMREILDRDPLACSGTRVIGDWVLVLLDTHVPGSDAGGLTEDSLRGLDAALSDNGERHALVCLHHHPVPVGSAWLDAIALTEPERLLQVLDDHRWVRGILWGHVHQACDGQRAAMRLLGTPSTGGQFAPHTERFAAGVGPPAYRRLELLPDGNIETEVLCVPIR